MDHAGLTSTARVLKIPPMLANTMFGRWDIIRIALAGLLRSFEAATGWRTSCLRIIIRVAITGLLEKFEAAANWRTSCLRISHWQHGIVKMGVRHVGHGVI